MMIRIIQKYGGREFAEKEREDFSEEVPFKLIPE